MIHDWRRVILPNDTLSFSLEVDGHLPRFMYEFIWDIRQFRHETADVSAAWVKFPALQKWVKNAEIRRSISSGSGDPLPTAVVCCWIAVNQVLHKIAFSPAPIDQQIFGEKRSHNHACSIMHPTGLYQLPY